MGLPPPVRGQKPENRFIDFVVREGLATAFGRDVTGNHGPWSDYPDDATSEQWVRELLRLAATAKYEHWMYDHPDGRRYVGYRAGTFIVDRATATSGRNAADLVTTPTSEILRMAGLL